MFRRFWFGKKKLLLSFEYGMIITKTAQEMKVELTPELSERAERMIYHEFTTKNPTRLSVDMIPNIMSIFELDLTK